MKVSYDELLRMNLLSKYRLNTISVHGGLGRRTLDHPLNNFKWCHCIQFADSLPCFTNLKRLSLFGMTGRLCHWLSWILDLLLNCPDLNHLGLSMTIPDVIVDPPTANPLFPAPDDRGLHHPACCHCLTSLCDAYGKVSVSRLKLRSIRLSDCMRLPNAEMLSRLTDLAYLEEVHVGNL